jgi:MFS family permease
VQKRKFLAATFLISGTLSWFFILNLTLFGNYNSITWNEPNWIYYNVGQLLFYGFAVFSALLGGLFARRIERSKLLFYWITLGVVSTISLLAFQNSPLLAISSVLLGFSLGFGLPSSLAFMAECTAVEERGRVSGVIILATFVLAFIVLALTQVFQLDATLSVLLFAALRGVSYAALGLDKCDGKNHTPHVTSHLPGYALKEYLYYLVPWVMFCVAAGLAWNLIPQTSEYDTAVRLGQSLRYIAIAASSLVAGVIADRVGRKQPVIIGLIILGLSFALLGFAMSPTALVIYLVASGVAWGALFVVFLAIPADLSVRGSCEKFYGLGYVLPLAILFALEAIPGSAIFSSFSASSFALILSMILFISMIPVLRAKETLPSKKVAERQLKEHLEKVEETVHESNGVSEDSKPRR